MQAMEEEFTLTEEEQHEEIAAMVADPQAVHYDMNSLLHPLRAPFHINLGAPLPPYSSYAALPPLPQPQEAAASSSSYAVLPPLPQPQEAAASPSSYAALPLLLQQPQEVAASLSSYAALPPLPQPQEASASPFSYASLPQLQQRQEEVASPFSYAPLPQLQQPQEAAASSFSYTALPPLQRPQEVAASPFSYTALLPLQQPQEATASPFYYPALPPLQQPQEAAARPFSYTALPFQKSQEAAASSFSCAALPPFQHPQKAAASPSSSFCLPADDPAVWDMDPQFRAIIAAYDADFSSNPPDAAPQWHPEMAAAAAHYHLASASQELTYFSSLATEAPAAIAASPYTAQSSLAPATSMIPGTTGVPPAPPPRRPRGRPRGSTASKRAAAARNGDALCHRQSPGEAAAGALHVQPLRHAEPELPAMAAKRQLECTDRHAQSTGSGGGGVGSEEEEEEVEYAVPEEPGVRFRPKPAELLWYLNRKYRGRVLPVSFIVEFNVYQSDPETIPEKCECVDGYWYVFSPRMRKYQQGNRPARSDGKSGFWKSNTKESNVEDERGKIIGKTNGLAHENGHQPKGVKTGWKMREYRIPTNQRKKNPSNPSMLLDEWVICQVCFRSAERGGTSRSEDLQKMLCAGASSADSMDQTKHGIRNSDQQMFEQQ